MSSSDKTFQTLRNHRPLLLACEAIGWLHMAGKAKADFLRKYGGQPNDYDSERWIEQEGTPFNWSDQLNWVKKKYPVGGNAWPSSLTEFVTKHRKNDPGLLGLLQAGHGMASGIEKNVPRRTSEYLNQDVTHMWLSSPFGHPVRNLLSDPPPLLAENGWQDLLRSIKRLLDELQALGVPNPPHSPNDLDGWWQWREAAIGPNGWLRQAFLSTLAETRLPNNDVTLWDQSYVAAALFKSAVAGAVFEKNSTWGKSLKQRTRWRVLTIGFGTRHYEARAVKIGDWVGAQQQIESFFERVRCFIEVDLAVGSLVYRDDETLAFTFPGQHEDEKVSLDKGTATQLKDAIAEQIDCLAAKAKFETPPYCQLSCSTRSFVPMVRELRTARDTLQVPLHRSWEIPADDKATDPDKRHVCPVCRVRLNAPPERTNTDNVRKSYPCGVCRERRQGRLEAWLAGKEDTIWIDEVADENNRVALLTLNFDIEPWLEGQHVDSLRAQSIADWRRFNPVLNSQDNPVDAEQPRESLLAYIESKLGSFDKKDPVLRSLQEGYEHEKDWKSFFTKIVEDRADAPQWDQLDDTDRARWLAHQLFRKLPSPGRVYRFWRTAEDFFEDLLAQFRTIAFRHANRWRTRRLLLTLANNAAGGTWEDRETYTGLWHGAPFELLYLKDRKAFITICNLARCFRPEEIKQALAQEPRQQVIRLKGDDGEESDLRVTTVCTPEKIGCYAPVIRLDLSPRRFRVLVPLDRATACIESAIAKWREEFARVWDRMPLRIGIVVFPRLSPFQAVIEAARNLEDALTRNPQQTWRVVECRTRQGMTELLLEHQDGLCDHGTRRELLLVPTALPDGRTDVFYPYVQVEDRELRSPHDFQHPDGRVYRHMADLRPGDGIVVHPSCLAAVFLDTTVRRFESPVVRPLGDFERMGTVWDLVVRSSPSLSALRGAWFELEERLRSWRGPDGRWLPGSEAEWLELVRAILRDRLGLSGAHLETLVEAAAQGTLEWALEWHLTWLKEGLEGAET